MSRPLVLLLVLACVACSQEGDSGESRSTSHGKSKATNAAAHAGGAVEAASPVVVKPAELRPAMEKLFGHHAILMIRLMRAKIDEEPRLVEAVGRGLRRNTRELSETLASVYGATAATSFRDLWTQRIDALAAYSAAHADGDEAALAKARTKLNAYPARYGDAVNELTRGRLAEAPARQRMSEHITLLMRSADAYAAIDFPTAFATERTTYSAMFDHGTAFAKAAVLKRLGYLPTAFDDRPARLRSGLARLLGEHSALAFEATRSVVSSKPAAEAAAEALNENTKDLLGALGTAPAKQFGGGWADSVDGLVRFAVAVAEYDAIEQARARAALDAAPRGLGARLSALTGGRVAAQTVASALRLQNERVLQEVVAYAAADLGTSHDLAYAQYNHMFALSDTVASVLEGYTTVRAPRGGAETGGRGSGSR